MVQVDIGQGKVLRLADDYRVDIDRAAGELRMAFGHDAVLLDRRSSLVTDAVGVGVEAIVSAIGPIHCESGPIRWHNGDPEIVREKGYGIGGFTTLAAGTAGDTFTVAAASTANLLGGTGADIFNINTALTGG